ncbi:MAG: HlyD family secretion protein [Pseudomonadota bacterium]
MHRQAESVPVANVTHIPVTAPQPPAGRRVLIIVTIASLIALVAIGRLWWRNVYYVETDNAYVVGHVHPLSSRIAGVVTHVHVEDNQFVREGDVIVDLDPADQRIKVEQFQAEITSAQRQIVQADAQIAQAQAQADSASAEVAQAKALSLRANQDAERYKQLYTDEMKAVSQSDLEGANAARTAAEANTMARGSAAIAARAQIVSAQSAREVLKAQVKVLETQLKDTQQQLAYNRIVAPVSGRIGKRSVEVGARVQPGQALVAIVQDNVWVTANYKETQLSNLRPGQAVSVSIDALPDVHLTGHIDSFSPASGAQFSLLPPDNATGNFTKIVQRVPVKIRFSPEDIKPIAERLVPGMSVIAIVDLRKSAQGVNVAAK